MSAPRRPATAQPEPSVRSPGGAGSSPRRAVGGLAATLAIAKLTLVRLLRGKAIWVSGLLALTPALVGALISARHGRATDLEVVLEVSNWLLAILPALHVASSLSEELEQRTSAYLWSRPIPRWTIVSGKLLALVPLVAVLEVGGGLLGLSRAGADVGAVAGRVGLGLGLGVLAASAISAGMSTLWPKHGMSISMVYVLFVDLAIGAVPASLRNLSVTHHVRELIGPEGAISATPVIGLGVIALVWMLIALRRIGRLE